MRLLLFLNRKSITGQLWLHRPSCCNQSSIFPKCPIISLIRPAEMNPVISLSANYHTAKIVTKNRTGRPAIFPSHNRVGSFPSAWLPFIKIELENSHEKIWKKRTYSMETGLVVLETWHFSFNCDTFPDCVTFFYTVDWKLCDTIPVFVTDFFFVWHISNFCDSFLHVGIKRPVVLL